MKKIILNALLAAALLVVLLLLSAKLSSHPKVLPKTNRPMKCNAGIITPAL